MTLVQFHCQKSGTAEGIEDVNVRAATLPSFVSVECLVSQIR